jgi:hypothetical protein
MKIQPKVEEDIRAQTPCMEKSQKLNKIIREIMACRSVKNEKPRKPIVRKDDNCAC